MLHCFESRGGGKSRTEQYLRIELDGRSIELAEGVDTGETHEDPLVWLVRSTDSGTAFCFGGETAYRFDRNMRSEPFRTFRERRFDEYWEIEFVPVGEAALAIIYESGVLYLDMSLRPLWQAHKMFNDRFLKVEPSRLLFVRDDQSVFALDIDVGRSSEVPVTA